MSLRARLAVAFFILLLGPIVVGAALTYLAVRGGPVADPQSAAVRAVVTATCDRLAGEATAAATQAKIRGETYAVTDPGAPLPWAMCGVNDPSLLPLGTRFGTLAARSEIDATQGAYAYAVQPIDAGLMRQLSAAAACAVTVVGTGQAPIDAAQPLPLACAGPTPARAGVDWLVIPVCALAMLITIGVAWWLASLATRPLSRLLRAVDRIIAGDLDARPAIGGRDEAARLGRGLDALVGGMREAQRLSLTDPLTGVGNLRRLRESLRHEAERAGRFGRCLGVLVLDLDHFKEVNDDHGHRAGDAVLVEFAQRVRAVVREVDLVFRQGGEEFVVLLPETDIPGSLTAARRIGESMRDTPFAVTRFDGEPALIPVTVSVGVAVFPRHALTGQELLDSADQAMYVAKTAGRDTFALAAGPLEAHGGRGSTVQSVPGGASGGTAVTQPSPGR